MNLHNPFALSKPCPLCRLALLGAGKMAGVFLNQVKKHYPQIQIAMVICRKPQKALKLLKRRGFPASEVYNAQELSVNTAKGIVSVTNNLIIAKDCPVIDAFLEMTGSIEFGAKAALLAFETQRHFMNFNSELDSLLGPVLTYKARQSGVIYSGTEGDQPGMTMKLHDYVCSLGMQPLVCGSLKGMLDPYRTPATQAAFAAKWKMSPKMVTSFADGTKLNMEQSCIANAANMQVAQRGMQGHRVSGHIDDYMKFYDVDELKKRGGVVDYLIGAAPKPGVFIYATTDDEVVKEQLHYLKMGEGPMYSFYTPFHLCALDLPATVVQVMQNGKPLFAPYGGPKVEVIALAKTSLKTGQLLDGIGGFTMYGECENHSKVRADKLIPLGLCEGVRLKRTISKDQLITFDDVEITDRSLAMSLYEEQNEAFPDPESQNAVSRE